MTKAELQTYRWIKAEAHQLAAKIEVLRVQATSAGTMNLSGMPPTGGQQDPVADAVARIDELREKYAALLKELVRRQEAIEAAIACLDGTERLLMRARYIDGMTWEHVAEYIAYSRPQAYVIHRRALRKLERNTNAD